MKNTQFKAMIEEVKTANSVEELSDLFHCGFLFINLTDKQLYKFVFELVNKGDEYFTLNEEKKTIEFGEIYSVSINWYLDCLLKEYNKKTDKRRAK